MREHIAEADQGAAYHPDDAQLVAALAWASFAAARRLGRHACHEPALNAELHTM